MKKNILILLITAIALLAVFLYWPDLKPPVPSPTITLSPTPTQTVSPSPTPTPTPTSIINLSKEISRGDITKKQIIFTFDAGAATNSATEILAIAKKHNLKITFFVTGEFAQKNSDLITQISSDGHEIFNHTYSHPHLPLLTDEEIKVELEEADIIISQITSKTTKPYFRPPYGDRNAHVLKIAAQAGWQSIYWSTDALDWQADRTAEEVKQRIYSNLKNGAIFLMHIGDDITGQILDEVFTYIENKGYKITDLSEGLK